MDIDLFNAKKSLNTINPHSFLGLHDKRLIYQFSPNKKENTIIIDGKKISMEPLDHQGYFYYESPRELSSKDYQVIHTNGHIGLDPYNFSSSFSLVDGHLLTEGKHLKLHEALGSHICTHDGVVGTRFAVYAPNAICVHLRCDLGNWREKIYPMRKVFGTGVFELFIPGATESMHYKYAITTKNYKTVLKSDPFARHFEMRPNTASKVHKCGGFKWTDKEWLKMRRNQTLQAPMNIYELHLGSWCSYSRFPNYKEIAFDVANYVKEMGYTHVELLPIKEHPLDESWGYQPSGYFAPTSRYGTPDDFKYFVNHLHMMGIGIVFDFVSAHFPKDESFLSHFDGGPLFENEDPVMKHHPVWDTLIFNYSSAQVRSFLISSILFWIEEMHIDIIRVDAVHSILYLNYGREDGAFKTNEYGGVENLEGIDFLKELNTTVQENHPDVMMIAEDSSIHGDITKSIDDGGLGFSMKWNVGWFNDLSQYMKMSDHDKQTHHKQLLNSYKEAFQEKYLLTISHDEVSCGRGPLISQFSNDPEKQYAFLRLLYSVAIAHPGKKLFFMGTEVGEKIEFDEKRSWRKSPFKDHGMIKHKGFTKAINHFYLNNKALFEIDFDEKGFAWIDHSDYNQNVLSFVRKSTLDRLLVIHNFSSKSYKDYTVNIPYVIEIEEVFNTDEKVFGGNGLLNPEIKIDEHQRGVHLNVPALGTVICKVVLDDKKCII